MTTSFNIIAGSLFGAAVALAAGSASAATLTFDGDKTEPYLEDGFAVDPARIVNGNCDSPSGRPCLALNDNETSTLTYGLGEAFSADSFWFQLLGRGTDNTLTVSSSTGGSVSLSASDYGFNDGGQVFSFSGLTGFTDILSLTFSTTGGGNVRIDDILTSEGGFGEGPAPVPLPAAGLLMVGALGGLAAARRRKAVRG